MHYVLVEHNSSYLSISFYQKKHGRRINFVGTAHFGYRNIVKKFGKKTESDGNHGETQENVNFLLQSKFSYTTNIMFLLRELMAVRLKQLLQQDRAMPKKTYSFGDLMA